MEMSASTLSLNSLIFSSGSSGENLTSMTPESSRRSSALQRAMNSLRNSGGKGSKSMFGWFTMGDVNAMEVSQLVSILNVVQEGHETKQQHKPVYSLKHSKKFRKLTLQIEKNQKIS